MTKNGKQPKTNANINKAQQIDTNNNKGIEKPS
jgi:hypothetical protein